MSYNLRFLIILIIIIITPEHGSDEVTSDSSHHHIKRHHIDDIKADINRLDELKRLLTSNTSEWQLFPIQYIPIIELNEEMWWQTQITKSQKYDSRYKYPPKHSLNHLIGSPDEIEIIISENDMEATKQWIDGFKYELSQTINVTKRFYKLQQEMGAKDNITTDDFSTDTIDINGFDTMSYYADPKQGNRFSTGMNGEYFKMSKSCTQLKGCNVYPIFRILHKTPSIAGKSFSCNDIMTQLMPQIYECVDQYGVKKCPLIIDNGYFRDVFKVKIPNTNRYVVMKMMRPKKYDDLPRDLQRNVRESILLYYLRKEELEYIKKYGSKFISSGEERAFPYVRELGHCLYPTYISVSPYYNLTLEKFIKRGLFATKTISELMKMALDIAKGTEVIHNIRGGPYQHSDIAIDQYMIDENGNVLLNDFNRGKFQTYRFPEDFNGKLKDLYDGIIKCRFCPYESDGRNRAPEELVPEPLGESMDIYSTAMVIWSLFSGTRLWTKPYQDSSSSSSSDMLNYDDIRFVVHETARKPIMPHNMPYALKNVINWAIYQDSSNRPTARQFRRRIQEIYNNLSTYTMNRESEISGIVRQKKLFKDHKYPKVPSNFPKCCVRKQKKKSII